MLGKANPSPSIGIIINDHTTLTNNNLIQVGVGGEGIEADGAHNRIINNGMITAGTNGVGILAGVVDGHNHIRNFGTISTHGVFADAIVVENGGTVFNAGTIANTTPGGVAIDFCSCSTGYKLTIAPTSVITGLVTATGQRHLPARRHRQRQLRRSTASVRPSSTKALAFSTSSAASGPSQRCSAKATPGTSTAARWRAPARSRTSTSIQAARCSPAPRRARAMKITGNLAFQTGAFYVVTLNGTTSTLAKVSGTASLAGNVQALLLPA